MWDSGTVSSQSGSISSLMHTLHWQSLFACVIARALCDEVVLASLALNSLDGWEIDASDGGGLGGLGGR